MGGFTSFAASTGPTAPAQLTYEYMGYTASGSGITATASGTTNTKGSTSNTLGTSSSAYCGFTLYVTRGSSSSARYLLDISFDGGSTWAVQNLYFIPAGIGSMADRLDIPVIVPASSDIRIRCQSSTGSATLVCTINGWVAGTNAPIGYTSMTNLFADTSTTRPSSTQLVSVGSGSTTYTTLVDPLAASYDAMMAVIDTDTTAVATSQTVTFKLATGAAASEADYYKWAVGQQDTSNNVPRGWTTMIRKSIASGVRLSAQALTNSTTNNEYFMNVYGFTA